MASAALQADGHYLSYPPRPVKESGILLARLQEEAGEGCSALLGFDFPIGLPLAYAQRAGIRSFLAILPQLGKGKWSKFYEPALTPGEISLYRPFYPARAGHTRQQHLVDHLGVASIDDLRRRCERPHPGRRAACPLFWTLGAQQVGKAAISGWKEVFVGQGGSLSTISFWPFSGKLGDLLAPGQLVIAETYPAEFYSHLDLEFTRRRGERSGKRVQADRRRNAAALLRWAAQAQVELLPALHTRILEGFGPSPEAEDPFDAVVGLFGMLNVVLGRRLSGEPEEEDIRNIEGWILGQEYITKSETPK